jgi:hypothetical protein
LVVGALLLLAWVIFSGRHNKPSPESRRHSASSGRPIISDPIPMTGGARSDFARRFQARLSKAKSTFSNFDSRTDSNPWKHPAPPVPTQIPDRYGSPPITPSPMTPMGYGQRDSAVESIRIYSPPNMVQHPSASVAPLRTMAVQRHSTVSALGSPYKSPLKVNDFRQSQSATVHNPEVLGAQRYEADSAPLQRPPPVRHEMEDSSKRDTSFTALMQHCNIPDRGDEFPVPRIPKAYEPRM